MINEIIYDGLVLKTSCRYFDVKAGNTDSLVEDRTRSLMTLTFRPGSTNASISKFLGIKKVGATQEIYATTGPKIIRNTTVTLNGLKLKKLTTDNHIVNIVCVNDSDSRVVQTYNYTTIVVNVNDRCNQDFVNFLFYSGNLLYLKPVGPKPKCWNFYNFPKINIKDTDLNLTSTSEFIYTLRRSYDDYVIKRNNLARELNDLELYDEAVIIKRFMDGELILSDFSPVSVSKCYSRFLGDNCDVSKGRAKKDDFRNLYHNLDEYKHYLKFNYLLDDFRKKYAERVAHKDDLARITKEINTLVGELVKLTGEINEGSTKGFLFFRKKVDIEQHYLTVNEKVKELDAKYEEYDKALVYSKLNEFITDTSTIYDVFRFVVSFKGYLRACIKENVEDADIKKVKETVKEFDAFLSDPNISVLNNLAFTVENDVALIIIDHYKLLEITLNMDELTPEGIDGLKQALEIINISNSLEEYDLSIDFIENLFEAKKIINSNK